MKVAARPKRPSTKPHLIWDSSIASSSFSSSSSSSVRCSALWPCLWPSTSERFTGAVGTPLTRAARRFHGAAIFASSSCGDAVACCARQSTRTHADAARRSLPCTIGSWLQGGPPLWSPAGVEERVPAISGLFPTVQREKRRSCDHRRCCAEGRGGRPCIDLSRK